MYNKENIEKWCVALESGEYKQGTGRLHTPETNSYCCVGVAAKEAGLEIEKYVDRIVGGDVDSYGLVYAWLFGKNHIHTDRGVFISGEDRFFPALNDRFKLTFEEIAHCVRVHHLGENNGVIRQSIVEKIQQYERE